MIRFYFSRLYDVIKVSEKLIETKSASGG